MKIKISIMSLLASTLAAVALTGCVENIEMRRPQKFELPDLPPIEEIHNFKAPLYWSVYEYCHTQSQSGVKNEDMDITAAQWEQITDWLARDLKPYGYDMVCTDGFISQNCKDGSPYMTHYGSMSIKELVEMCKKKGLKVGIYDNPLWVHAPWDTKVPDSEYTVGDLLWDHKSEVLNPGTEDMWGFQWVVASYPGAKEYIDGFFKHYAELGIDYIRVDFLSWYEDGKDRNMGPIGRGYGRESYVRALSYIAENAKKYGIFISLVMPHLYYDAEIEKLCGNMVRIVQDTGNGGWWHYSDCERGKSWTTWPNCMNMFDGFVYWSHISGRGKVLLDGDFIRLNTFNTDAEKESVVSLQLMAGGPVTIADQYNTIGDNTRFYTNTEMLALNTDGFVGKPLSDELNSKESQIWYGQLSDGNYVIGLFNRDDNAMSVSVDFKTLGIDGEWKVRDLWKHADEGVAKSLSATLAPHGCKIVKLTK